MLSCEHVFIFISNLHNKVLSLPNMVRQITQYIFLELVRKNTRSTNKVDQIGDWHLYVLPDAIVYDVVLIGATYATHDIIG